MPKTASTHRGHCQLCGSLQKLPKTRLSLHGYTVEGGYFSGICRGSKELPFELSFALILDEIQRATNALTELRERIDDLRTHVDADTKMWVQTYVPRSGRLRSRYIWEPVTLHATMPAAEPDGWQRINYSYVQHGGKEAGRDFHGVPAYDKPGATCEELRQASVLLHNQRYCEYRLDKEAHSLARYIAWQRARIHDWKEMPLLPHDAKDDKQAFNPEEK